MAIKTLFEFHLRDQCIDIDRLFFFHHTIKSDGPRSCLQSLRCTCNSLVGTKLIKVVVRFIHILRGELTIKFVFLIATHRIKLQCGIRLCIARGFFTAKNRINPATQCAFCLRLVRQYETTRSKTPSRHKLTAVQVITFRSCLIFRDLPTARFFDKHKNLHNSV